MAQTNELHQGNWHERDSKGGKVFIETIMMLHASQKGRPIYSFWYLQFLSELKHFTGGSIK
jgi:hypothetical protein